MQSISNARRYGDVCRLVPLRITCELYQGAQVAQYDPIMFDGILANAAVREMTGGGMLPPSLAPYEISLPLHCLWRSEEGLPLWAATCLYPVEPTFSDMLYLHKRAQTGQFTQGKKGKFSINVSVGRWMERRVPTPTILAARWEALAIGDLAEIQRLLPLISHIGKRRAAGMGEVRAWGVEALPALSIGDLLIRDHRLSRPIPLDARHLIEGWMPDAGATLTGWTPPYWHPGTLASGWRAGTPVIREEVPA